MENWTYRLRTPTTVFKVLKVLDRNERSRYLRVQAEDGKPVDLWLSRKYTSFYQYKQAGEVRMEIKIPDWLAAKTGLIEGG